MALVQGWKKYLKSVVSRGWWVGQAIVFCRLLGWAFRPRDFMKNNGIRAAEAGDKVGDSSRRLGTTGRVFRLCLSPPASHSILKSMRLLVIAAAALLTGCASAPPPGADAAEPAWYGRTVDQLADLNRSAEQFFKDGKSDQAAAAIEKGEPLVSRLLSVPKPSLAAVEAASDLDDLYGRMLLSNRHYAWAITMFEKNRSRWKNWTPQTPETARRLKQAETDIEECDRHMAE
jgi:hypothetical protein